MSTVPVWSGEWITRRIVVVLVLTFMRHTASWAMHYVEPRCSCGSCIWHLMNAGATGAGASLAVDSFTLVHEQCERSTPFPE